MDNNAKRRTGGVEVWAYRRGMLGRADAVRTAVVAILAVVVVMAAVAFYAPREAAGAVEHVVAEEIAHIEAASTNAAATSGEESSLPRTVQLEVPSLSQNPVLPTGCESVALTDVLLYHGFDLGLTDIADYWMPRSDSDFVNAFMGDPYSVEGNSCMAPCVAQTASAYLASQGSSLMAYDATDMTVEEMLRTVATGTPVIAWCTIDLADPGEPYAVARQDGRVYGLYDSNHCVVVNGYDLNENLVYTSDPLEGQKSYNLALFISRYYELGAQAVVVV